MADGFDISELEGFQQQLINDVAKKYPKTMRKFMRKEAKKVQEIAEQIARSEIKEDTGNYFKGFKIGKSGLKGAYAVKAYNQAPHGHLIEDGHNQYGGKGNKTIVGFVEGKKIYARAQTRFKSQFEQDVQNFADEMLYHSVCAKYGGVGLKR